MQVFRGGLRKTAGFLREGGYWRSARTGGPVCRCGGAEKAAHLARRRGGGLLCALSATQLSGA